MYKKRILSLPRFFFLTFVFSFFLFFLFSCQTSLWKETPPQNNPLPSVSVNGETEKETGEEYLALPFQNTSDTSNAKDTKNLQEKNQTDDTVDDTAVSIQKNSSESNTSSPDQNKKSKEEDFPFTKHSKNKQPIRYSGDVFIREKKYHKYFGKKVQVLTISGHVKIRQGTTQLFAPKVEILGNDNGIILTSNGVKIIDRSTVISAKHGEYHRFDKKVLLSKNCKITHTKKNKSKIVITSDKLEYSFVENKSYARDNVHISALPYTAQSDKAIYEQTTDILTLTDNPFVYHENTIYHAENILLYREKENIEMNNNVSIWHTEINENKIERTNKENNKNAKIKVLSLITAHKASRTKTAKDIYKTEFFSESSSGQIRLVRKDIFFYTDYAMLYGEQQMEAKGNIQLIDREKGNKIFAESGNFSTDGKIVQFFSVTKNNQLVLPIAIIADEQKKASAFLQANHMEKNDVLKKIISRGDVKLEFLDETQKQTLEVDRKEIENKKRVGSIFLGGELAELPNSENKIYLTGRPYVLQNAEKISAREIVVDNDKHSLQLKGSLQGKQQIE